MAKSPSTSKAHEAMVDNDPAEIDLELSLWCGPSKVVTYYEFLPIKKEHGHDDNGAPSGSEVKETHVVTNPYPNRDRGKSVLFCEPRELLLMPGANADGAGWNNASETLHDESPKISFTNEIGPDLKL